MQQEFLSKSGKPLTGRALQLAMAKAAAEAQKMASAVVVAFPKGAPKGFMSKAIAYHTREGNLESTPNGFVLTAKGKAHMSGRVKDLALADAVKKAVKSEAAEFEWGGQKYPLVPISLSTGMKRYLDPKYWVAGSAVSQAFFSAIWLH